MFLTPGSRQGRKQLPSAPLRTVFTTVGANTWFKPAGLNPNSLVRIQVWGGGGSGGRVSSGTANSPGGGGGGYNELYVLLSTLPASVIATVGAGGAAQTAAAAGNNGTNSTFGSILTGYFGQGGQITSLVGGCGGGSLSAPTGSNLTSLPGTPWSMYFYDGAAAPPGVQYCGMGAGALAGGTAGTLARGADGSFWGGAGGGIGTASGVGQGGNATWGGAAGGGCDGTASTGLGG